MKAYSKKTTIKKRSFGNTAKKKNIKKKYTKNKKNTNKQSSFGMFKFVLYVVLFFLIASFILMLFLYNNMLKNLPSVSELENYNIAESSNIYDRNGKELYSVFKEKRTYVPFDNISINVVNALVAGEDKKFWTNPGFDSVGLIRAGLNYITGKDDTPGGTSTLTQQLIRNTIIEKKAGETKWEGIERKVQEIYLSYQLTKHGISKEKVIELYLNKIAYGHNAYGIEEASKTFFDTHAKELNILQSSILASLPKGPTYFSPYNHKDRLVGNVVITEQRKNGETGEVEDISVDLLSEKDLQIHKSSVEQLQAFLKNLKVEKTSGNSSFRLCGINEKQVNKKISKNKVISISNGCSFIAYSDLINFLGSINIVNNEQTISYNPGRKDYILQRMLEDGYITFEEYQKAVIGGIDILFHVRKEKINAPHFVFYVREYLEKKYGIEAITMGGLKIYTTLDFEAQKKAEEIVKNQSAANASKFNAKNAALISIDNETGGIIAMVGSADYYNEDIKGQVNVTTSRIQPGSSFKPFVYSVAMEKSEIGTKTPVYDLKTVFPGGYEPGNFDGKFMGKMTIASALNHSRNIPAIKMYYMAGETKNILEFMKKLGVTSINESILYGASLALGTAEMTPLELAGAYSVFADMGEKTELNPILKIEDSKGNIIEDNSKAKKKRVISTGQAFLINHILSETSSRPSSWNKFLDLPDRLVAAKTGTSTKPSKTANGQQRAANLWTIGYTPQVTTVVWSGNTDGEDLYRTANGLEASGPIWNAFMKYIHQGKPALKWKLPSDVKSINISANSGYLPQKGSTNTILSYFMNTPSKQEKSRGAVEYDILCYGPVTDETPKSAIKTGTVLEFHSLKPSWPSWENPVQAWAKSYTGVDGIVGEIADTPCDRGEGKGDFRISSNITSTKPYRIGENPLTVAYVSGHPVTTVEIFLDGNIVQTLEGDNTKKGGVTGTFFIPRKYLNSTVALQIKATDTAYYTSSVSYKILVVGSDTEIKDDINLEIDQVFEEGEIQNDDDFSRDKPTQDTINESEAEAIDVETTETSEAANSQSSASIDITKPASGSISIYQQDYFNLRANISGGAKTEVFIDGGLHANLGDTNSVITSINQNTKLSVGTHKVLVRTTSSSGAVTEKNITVNILQ